MSADKLPSSAKVTSETLDRRSMLKALSIGSAAAILPVAFSQSRSAQPLPILKLHSFGLRVSDVEKSVAFYQSVFGSAIQARRGETVFLQIGAGPRYFSISALEREQVPGITHIGLSVENYDLANAKEKLGSFGLTEIKAPSSRTQGSSLDSAMGYWTQASAGDVTGEELYFSDIEGVTYHLASVDHCGGAGEFGAQCNQPQLNSVPGLFELEDISHFTTFLGNRDRANEFYTQLFGKTYQAYQGEGSPIIGIGDGLQFLMYIGGSDQGTPSAAGRIDHACFTMHGFSVNDILDKLSKAGLRARVDARDTQPLMHWVSMRMPNRGGVAGGTPEVYFSDPDGIRIQLQGINYCGGGGYFGDSCPVL